MGEAPNPLSLRGRRKPSGTRDRIVTLARNIIAQGGLSELKARRVAQEAEVSVGTVYNLFGHLDDLVRLANAQTYDSLFAHQTDALARARADGLPVRAQLHALAQAYLVWVGEHHSLWSAALAFNRERQGEAPDWYRDKELSLLAIIEDALSGLPSDLPEARRATAARALWAGIHGNVMLAMGRSALLQPTEQIEAQMRLIVDGVVGALASDG